MNIEITPMDILKNIHTVLSLIFSGLNRDEKGDLVPGKGEFRESEEAINCAMYKLSEEFPDLLPGYYVQMFGKVPFSQELEDVLFGEDAFGVIRRSGNSIIVSQEIRNLMAKHFYGHENLERYLDVVERFQEIVKVD